MKFQISQKKLTKMLAENLFNETLQAVLYCMEGTNHHQVMIISSSRAASILEQIRLGITSSETSNIELNKLRANLNYYIPKIEYSRFKGVEFFYDKVENEVVRFDESIHGVSVIGDNNVTIIHNYGGGDNNGTGSGSSIIVTIDDDWYNNFEAFLEKGPARRGNRTKDLSVFFFQVANWMKKKGPRFIEDASSVRTKAELCEAEAIDQDEAFEYGKALLELVESLLDADDATGGLQKKYDKAIKPTATEKQMLAYLTAVQKKYGKKEPIQQEIIEILDTFKNKSKLFKSTGLTYLQKAIEKMGVK